MHGFLGTVNHFTNACGLSAHSFLHHCPASLERNHFVGHPKWIFPSNAFTNHNKPFQIYTDTSSLQLGAYILQNDKHVAFWSHKLNYTHLKYTVVTKNLFSIAMVLMEF